MIVIRLVDMLWLGMERVFFPLARENRYEYQRVPEPHFLGKTDMTEGGAAKDTVRLSETQKE